MTQTEPTDRKPRSVRRLVIRGLLLAFGVGVLAAFIWTAGPAEIASNIARIGWGFGYLLLLSLVWRSLASTGMWLLFERHHAMPWWKVFLIRSAGESVNMLTPFGNVGGEPVKAMMLKRELGGTQSTGFVLLDKTIFFLSSLLFMTTGTLLGAVILADQPLVIGITLGLLVPWVLVLAWIVWRQMRGDFVVTVSRVVGILRIKLSDKTLGKLEQVDSVMSTFWRGNRKRFLASFLCHFLGRALRTADVWICVWLLGAHITWSGAYFTAAAGMLVSSSFVFIPGALGASEGGHALVLDAIGLGVAAGVTVGLVRRIRNYIVAGLGYGIVVFWPSGAPARDRSQATPSPRPPAGS